MEPYSEQVMRCIEIALSCVEMERKKRPSIGDIIDKLNKMEIKYQMSSDQILPVETTPAQASLLVATSYTPQETANTKGVSRLREHIQYAMGDLVIGLAKSVAEGALTKVQPTIEKAKMELRMQHDLVYITGEFQVMQSFRNVADEESIKNKLLMTWVREMRELAYDLEDCFECIVIHKDTGRGREFLHRLYPCLVPPPLQLYMALDDIQQLRTRVEDVNKRNARYSLIGDSGSKHVLAQQQPAPRAAVGYDTRRQHFLGDLTQLITKKDDADLQVISVWGGGGDIGTTSIIRKSYSDPEINHSFTCRAWVNLRHPFNPHEFVRSLMAHFYANSCQERQGAIIGIDVLMSMDASATQGDLLNEFVQLVDKNRYLVVLEDLSTMAEWDSIRAFLPDRKNGSWIIVSSQQYEIASLCVGYPCQVFNLKQLPAERTVCAFLREGSQDAGDKIEANNDSP